MNNGNTQYFTNLRLLTAGDNIKEYNNLSNDDTLITTNFHSGALTYYPLLNPSTSSSSTSTTTDLGGGISQTTTTTTTIIVVPISTTTTNSTVITNNDYTSYLSINNGSPVVPTKISGTDDWYFQLTTTNQTNTITINKPVLVDMLLVGSGGAGGAGSYGGGGGGGEIISVSNYTLPTGAYDINVKSLANDGSVSIVKNSNILLKASAGGSGGYYNNGIVAPTSGGSGGGGVGNYYTTRTADFYTYPPKAYNASNTEASTTFLGQSAYTMTLTLNSTGITYGIGDYVLYYSSMLSSFPTQYKKNLLFNYSVDSVGSHWESSDYNQPTGTYKVALNKYIVSDYLGDWIVIQLPTSTSISLSSFMFKARNGIVYRAPSLWRCYGSNDGVNFTLIADASNDTTALTSSNYTANTYTKTISSVSPFYSYIGFTFNKIVGSNTDATTLNFDELRLYGNKFDYATGASAGTPFSTTLTPNTSVVGMTSVGGNATILQGGDGGQATTTSYSIIGSTVSYGLKGSGATSSSSPSTKTGYGMGGDGNSGLPTTGTIIMRFKNLSTITSSTSSSNTVYQPQISTYSQTPINYQEFLLNSYKVPSNLLSKGYIEFQVSSLSSGGTIQFLQDELDRMIIDCSIISFE